MASGSFRVTAMGEIRLNVRWLAVIEPLPRSAVEVVDFGDRVNVVAKLGSAEVALLADLTTGDIALSPAGASHDVPELTHYAIAVLQARLAVDGIEAPPPGPPTTSFHSLAALAGATWLSAGEVAGVNDSSENGM